MQNTQTYQWQSSRLRWISQPARIRSLLLAQGGYYLVTGVWPLVSESTFQRVTGPKIDFWLVKTAGLLISVLGGILLMAAGRKQLSPEVALAGAGTAASLGGVDVVYSARRRISPVYLLDAVLQAAFLVAWGGIAWALTRGRPSPLGRLQRRREDY